MAQMTRFSQRTVLLDSTMSDIIWGNVPQPPPKKGAWIGIVNPISHNIETHIFRPRFERFPRNLVLWLSSTLVTRPTVKNSTSWKIQKHNISAAVQAISTEFGTLMQFDRPSWPFRPLKISNFENARWRRPPSWKSKNHYISAAVQAYQACLSVVNVLPFPCISPHARCLRQVHRSRYRRSFGFQSTLLCQISSLRLDVEVLDTFATHSKLSCKDCITAAITIFTGHTSATSLASCQMADTV